MISLADPIWKELEGGYRVKYDASIPLTILSEETNFSKIKSILEELFEELHHQGDVGIASYLSVPHLIEIGITRKIVDWRIVALIAIIEIERHNEENPTIPHEYEKEYLESLQKVLTWLG